MPSPKPTVPEKLFMLLDPVILRLTLPGAVEVPTDKRDNRIIRHYLAAIIGDMFRDEFPSRFFWEAELDVQLLAEEDVNGGSGRAVQESERSATSTKTLAYEISGQAAFVDIPGTILPTRKKLRAGITHVLNANAIYKALRDTNHPVLGFVESLEISWTDDSQKIAQSSTRGGGKAGTTEKVVGSILFLIVLTAVAGIGFVLYKRKRLGEEIWTLKDFVPGHRDSSASSSDNNTVLGSDDNNALSWAKESPAGTVAMGTAKTVDGVVRSNNARVSALSSIATSSKKMLKTVVKTRTWKAVPSSAGAETSVLPSVVSDMISSVDEGTDVEGGMSLTSGEDFASGSEFSFAAIGARLSKTIASSNGSVYSLPKNYQTDGAGDASVDISLDSSKPDANSACCGAPLESVLEADDEGHDTTSAEEESRATPAPGSQSDLAASADPLAAMVALMRETIKKGNVSYIPNDLTGCNDTKADASTPGTVEVNHDEVESVISGVTACTGEIASTSNPRS
jgi:hypothetical protein